MAAIAMAIIVVPPIVPSPIVGLMEEFAVVTTTAKHAGGQLKTIFVKQP